MSGIYLHIPFCKQACSYCDFYFVTRTGEREAFIESLVNEIRSYADTSYAENKVETLYIGGGTPSLLSPAQLEQLVSAVHDTFETEIREFTLEMNPDDVTGEYLAGLRELGVNRASMGVQSFNPDLLSFMNRAHDRQEALKCLELLSKSGFRTFTVDLIYGNPGQSLQELEQDIRELLVFDPPHVSAYSLTIESGTRLGKQVELGRLKPPEDDKVSDHFMLLNERLANAGINRYEVSNYSKPGHEAIHNSNYWRHRNYLGMGPGAHSFWWGSESSATRWNNKADLRKYLEFRQDNGRNKLVEEKDVLDKQQLAEERLMMGLRTRDGITTKEMKERYGYRFSERQMEYLRNRASENKVEIGEDGRIGLTDKGIVIADAIILDLITLT
ncbi:MAG: radical SAM family heme chaperone HemW [Balneolaceae bacterium]|nr:radical SAM family heme chaperone HemW [Balneolaceae bacterium]